MKITMEKIPAVRVTVELPNDLETYALHFLNIINNVKAYPQLFKAYNNFDNDVVIVAERDEEKDLVSWLEKLGTIQSIEHIFGYQPCIMDETDAEFNVLCDGEILPVNW